MSLFANVKKIWNSQKFQKLVEIVNIDEENLYIFRAIWGISIKFSGKSCLMTMIKVTKKQGFTLSLENIRGKTIP